MDGSAIARALKSADPASRRVGAVELIGALEERYGRSHYLLKGCSRSLTLDDLLARVLEKVVTCIDQYEERGTFWGWVHRIVLNEACDLRRQDPEFPPPPVITANAPLLCAVHQMLTRTGSAKQLGRMRAAFRCLSRRDQLLLKHTARRWPEKPSDRVIAARLEIPETLVRGYRYVAIHRLRHALEKLRGRKDALGTAEEPRQP